MSLRILLLTGLLLSATSAFAADGPPPAADEPKPPGPNSPGTQLDSMVQGVLDALGAIMRSIPQYAMPEVLPNGDIIIRRIRPEEPPKQQPGPEAPPPENGGVRT